MKFFVKPSAREPPRPYKSGIDEMSLSISIALSTADGAHQSLDGVNVILDNQFKLQFVVIVSWARSYYHIG